MADDDKRFEGKSEDEIKEIKEADLQAKLSRAADNTEAATTLAKLIADPDIARLLEAKKNNKDVRVVLGKEPDGEPDTKPDDKPVDLDELDRPAFAEHILSSFGKELGDLIDKKLEPLREEVKIVAGDFTDRKNKSIEQQIEGARKKYPDLDEFAKPMMALNAQTGSTLAVEELYKLVKSRVGGDITTDPKLETEKPDLDGPRKGRPKIERDVPLPGGGRGFDQLLKEGEGRLEAAASEAD